MNHHFKNIKKGFTLAEVLITLGVIGVVAALTLPSVIANYQEKQTVVRLETAYSLLSQAFRSMIADNGEIDSYGSSANDRILAVANLFPKYVQTIKNCTGQGPDHFSKCTNTYLNRITNQSGVPTGNKNYAFILKNGMSVSLLSGGTCEQDMTLEKAGSWELDSNVGGVVYGTYHHNCGIVYVDIDGKDAGRNTRDIDMFAFALVKDGIVPIGTPKEKTNYMSFYDCLNRGTGYCTGWVLINKNLDYLKCPEKLGWDKAKSCKDK